MFVRQVELAHINYKPDKLLSIDFQKGSLQKQDDFSLQGILLREQ